jgi:tetratricopeptide (TPR) repeat protein
MSAAIPTPVVTCVMTGLFYAAAALNQLEPVHENPELPGERYYMLGDFKKAVDALERAAAMYPSDSTIQTWLGRAWGRRAETSFALLAAGYATKSRQAFERALQLNPGNTAALSDLFDFYMDAPGLVGGGLEKAVALLPQFEKYDPVGSLLAQARIDERKKQFASAEENLRRAIGMEPRKIGLFISLAQFLYRRGRYDESEKEFGQAANVVPDSPRILYARADSYISARRNLDQARDLLKKYLAANNLTPDDPPRWQAMSLLRKAGGG